MSFLPFTSGKGTLIFLSKRPGLTAAGSSAFSWFVAPITRILSFWEKPSISVRIWLIVPLLELCSFPNLLDEASKVSISSIKIMHGLCLLAYANKSRTRFAPTPTYISSKWDPET